MELTHDFKTTVLERAQADPEFRVGLLTEAAECLLNGEPYLAKTLLRDYVNGNPSLNDNSQVFAAVCKHEGVHLHVSAA